MTVGPKGGAASLSRRIGGVNRWRDTFNPTRGLTMRRAVALCESYPRGVFADLMWTFGAPFVGIEASDADLSVLIELRSAGLLEMDWEINVAPPTKRGFDQKLADEQEAALYEAYDGLANIYEAIEHLALATFRGFAHLEKITSADGDLLRLQPVDQWNIVRDGSRGAWKYNPEANDVPFTSLADDLLIDESEWLIREVKRPVGRIALVKWIRENLSQKDWDAFIEIYGLPSWLIIMPPNVPADKEEEYETSAKEVSEGGGGALPHGSDAKAADQPRGNNPFKEHLEWLQQKLVLAGTGGMLTMLAESGSGTLAGAAHMETFRRIARSEARKIGEIFQRQIDAAILETHWPGQPALASFALCLNEEVVSSEFVKDVQALASAGYLVDPAQIEEKTGYRVELKAEETDAEDEEEEAEDDKPIANRAPRPDDPDVGRFLASARHVFASATAEDLQPVRTALAEALQGGGDIRARLETLRARLGEIAPRVIAAQAGGRSLADIIMTALLNGFEEATP